mgnify:FL=1
MRYLVFILSLFSVYISISVYINFRVQLKVLYPDRSDSKITSLNQFNEEITMFPNITVATIPIDAYRARYAVAVDFDLATEYLTKSEKINPYVGYTEYLKAQIYFALGNIDSSTFYAEKAFIKWPKSFDNYKMYLKTLAFQGDSTGIVSAYGIIEDVFRDRSEYAEEFINSLANAKLKFLIVDYSDRESITKDNLQGTWMKAFDYQGGKIQYDTLVKINFSGDSMISSSGSPLKFDLMNDTLSIYSANRKVLLTKSVVRYSKEFQTLIITNDPRTKKVEQFFKKQ